MWVSYGKNRHHATDADLIIGRRGSPVNASTKGIICIHGRGGDATQFFPYIPSSTAGPGYHAYKLAQAGYFMLSIDAGGGTVWGNQTSLDRVSAARSYLLAQGCTSVGLLAWSMGSLSVMNAIDRHTAGDYECAYLFAPALDLGWAAAQPTWSSEIITAYSGLIRSDYDPQLRGATAGRYTSLTPVRIAHASDDASIPVSETDQFITTVQGSGHSHITKRANPTGGHSFLFGEVPSSEVVSFFDANM